MYILQQDHISGNELSILVGHWTWLCMLRRPVLSIMNAVYHFIQQHRYKTGNMTSTVRRELLQLINIAPLICTDLTSRYSDMLFATDASMSGLGITYISMESIEAKQLLQIIYKQTLIKLHNNRDSDVQHIINNIKHEQWKTIVSRSWKYNTESTHINNLELKAVLTLLRRWLTQPNLYKTRNCILVDNTTAYYCLRKGRSSSVDLRHVMCQLSAMMLASGIIIHPVWVESENNPADHASRYFIHE